jgi:hypothetical protein
MKSDKYASYALLVEKISQTERGAENYTIGGDSKNGNFERDALKVKEEKGFEDIVHAKLYLCGLMYDSLITKKKTEQAAKRATERIERVNENNIDPISEQVLEQLN